MYLTSLPENLIKRHNENEETEMSLELKTKIFALKNRYVYFALLCESKEHPYINAIEFVNLNIQFKRWYVKIF